MDLKEEIIKAYEDENWDLAYYLSLDIHIMWNWEQR